MTPDTMVAPPTSGGLIRDITTGLRDTGLLLSWRWRAFRQPIIRVWIAIGACIMFAGLMLSANLGYMIKLMAATGTETAAGTFAATWILSLQRDQLGDIGALTLGGAIVAAVFAPFTGSSTLALAPVEDLHGMRLSRLHRYFDSLAINCVSGIGLLQLLALTAVTSVLTLDGQRGPAMLMTWVVWFLVIALTTSAGWTLEWVVRRWGVMMRRIVAAVMLAIAGIAVFFDPNHGKTLFGIGDGYAKTIRAASAGDLSVLILPTMVLFVIGTVLLFVGFVTTRQALALPMTVVHTSKERRAWRIPSSNTWHMAQTLLLTLWRTPECRRPVAAVVIVGVPGVAFVQMNANMETAVMLAVPLAIALAWGVNIFAVLGPGMTWLTSRPGLMRNITWISAGIQIAITYALTCLLWTVSTLAGKADPNAPYHLLTGGFIAAVLAASVSLYLSVNRPIRARLSGRGDALVPPLTALQYLMRLLFLACLPAAVAVTFDPPMQLLLMLASVVVALPLLAWSAHRWRNPAVRSQVVTTVAST